MSDLPRSQLQYQLVKQAQGYNLQLREGAPLRRPDAHEVLVRVHATSLNRRDVMILRGHYPVGARESLVPLSDGAGEVVATGSAASRFKPGDRVTAAFFPQWIAGRPVPATKALSLGGSADGMLAQFVTVHEQGLVRMPDGLSYEEAATLPCAAVTAWSGLFTHGRLQAGDNVLLQGTGGVSVFGLQFAAAAGAKPWITSSSDAKLARARQLGAVGTLNYRSTPEWGKAIVEATGGVGAHHILEVGGVGTLKETLAAIGGGGHIALIGGLAGFGGDIPSFALIGRSASATGITVGSRAEHEAMNAFIERHAIRPVVDKVFGFAEAAAAYTLMESDSHFGKIVIRH